MLSNLVSLSDPIHSIWAAFLAGQMLGMVVRALSLAWR